MSNKLPNSSQFADRRQQPAKPTQEQINQQLQANIAQMRLNLSTQFLNTLIPIGENAENKPNISEIVGVAVEYADTLLIRLGIAQRQTDESKNEAK